MAGIQDQPIATTKTARHLQMLEQENSELQSDLSKVKSRIDQTKTQMHSTLSQEAPKATANGGQNVKSVGVMQRQLEQSRERGVEIRRNYEERRKGLTMQLQQKKHE